MVGSEWIAEHRFRTSKPCDSSITHANAFLEKIELYEEGMEHLAEVSFRYQKLGFGDILVCDQRGLRR